MCPEEKKNATVIALRDARCGRPSMSTPKQHLNHLHLVRIGQWVSGVKQQGARKACWKGGPLTWREEEKAREHSEERPSYAKEWGAGLGVQHLEAEMPCRNTGEGWLV